VSDGCVDGGKLFFSLKCGAKIEERMDESLRKEIRVLDRGWDGE